MKIAVFGATGGTGRSLVEQALAQGHQVTALVRHPAVVHLRHPQFTLFEGDAQDSRAVTKVIDGVDVVACILGLAKPQGTVISDATRTICQAMNEAGVRRLVAVTVMGLGDSKDNFDPVAKLFVRVFLKKGMEDRARQEEVITSSRLDYTLVRPSRLVDGAKTDRYSAGADVRAGISSKLTRADLASYVLQQLQTTTGSGARAVCVVGS
jgi:uncharacterized protein YbjT (DUF2867 family)